ncbi:MAG: hypothetical protein J6W88_02060 [Bacteroidales bacterium]|nr:hypothetical protein [Bacteroidales bacterium]
MIRRRILTLALLLASAVVVRANGDPVAVRSALTLSPTPVAVRVSEVQLIDEHVTFVPRGLYTDVIVRYLLHNHSDRSFDSLPYGFPIDYYGEGKAQWIALDGITESERESGWRDGYIRNVSFMLGERQLQWKHSRDTVIAPASKQIWEDVLIDVDTAGRNLKQIEDSLYLMYGEDMYIYTDAVSRRWYYTYLNLPAHSYAVLEVRYTVETPLSEGAYYRRENYYQYVGDYYWDLRFTYDFTPAAYWGDGHADYFSVQLDASDIDIIEKDNYWLRGFESNSRGIDGLEMKQKGDVWYYEARRFDLAAAKPFILDYSLKNRPQQPMEKIFNNRIDPSRFTVKVSGADPKYPASNLFDLDPSTTTVLRGDKNDSIYITVRFKEPTLLEGLMILNGYTKNADTWRNNGRIDSLLAYKTGYLIYGPVEDDKMDTTYYVNDNEIGWSFQGKRPVSEYVEGREPKVYSWQPLLDNANTFRLGDPWGKQYYTELHIVVTSAAKGLKYDDLCVSEILLIGK